MTDDAKRRLVLLARYLGPAPSRMGRPNSQVRHAARAVLADADLDELVAVSSFEELCDVLDSAGAGACALGLLDLRFALGELDGAA